MGKEAIHHQETPSTLPSRQSEEGRTATNNKKAHAATEEVCQDGNTTSNATSLQAHLPEHTRADLHASPLAMDTKLMNCHKPSGKPG
jgi:hypothetical protein